DATIALEVDIDCTVEGTPIALLFQSAPSPQTSDRTTNVLGARTSLPGALGEKAAGDVWVGLASQLGDEGGVQGWSISIAVDGLIVTEASTAGTVRDEIPNPSGAFEKTQVVDPLLNDQGHGVVSAIVLRLQVPVTLAPTGIATILRIGLESEEVVTEEGAEGYIPFRDGMRGAGQ